MRTLALAQVAISHVRSAASENAELLKNSGAFAAGNGITAALGFLYWWAAARAFPPEVVGNASALLSLMALVGLLGNAGLGTLLIGEIIHRQGRERGLIAAAAIAAVLLSVLLAGLCLFVSNLVFGTSGSVSTGGLSGLWFVIGCGLTGLSFVIDQAFVGKLQSNVRLLRLFLFSVSKLAFIVILAFWFSDQATILLTWVGGLLLSLLVIEWLARRRGESLIRQPDFRLLRTFKAKVAGHYMLDVSTQAPSIILPYLVAVLLSPAVNAAFYAIWMLLMVASVVPAALATVLFPVIQADPDQYRAKMRFSLTASLLFATAFSLFIFTYSSTVLALFNPIYADIAGSSLRFLGFGLIGAVVKFHVCAAARLRNSMRQASVWFSLGGLFELALAVAGCEAGGLEGLAIGWAAAVLIEALAMAVAALRLGWR